jgi:phage virion morphogenesis protein
VTGARIVSAFDDKTVLAAFTRLREVTTVSQGLMRAIGVGLVMTTQARFDREEDPDGNAWAPLLPAYAAIKRGPGILRESGMRGGLQGSITFEAGHNTVTVGSNKIYAAIHQFGGKIVPKSAKALVFKLGAGGGVVRVQSVTIPARPYLGFGAAEIDMVLDVTGVFVMRALKV